MRAVLLAFVAGCWLLQQQAALPAWWSWASVMGGAGVWWAARWRRVGPRGGCGPALTPWDMRAAVVVMAMAAGFGWGAWRAEARLGGWLHAALVERDIPVEGVVAGLPDMAEHGARFFFMPTGGNQSGRAAHTASGTASGAAVGTVGPDGEEPVGLPERLLLSWREPPEALQPGQRYRLTVRLRRPRGLANPHGFDYAYWLLAAGVGATGHVRHAVPILETTPSMQAPMPLAIRIDAWRARLRDHLRAALPDEARFGAVLVALVVGDQHGIAQADWEVFRRTGIAHLVSISGLHITMISGALGALAHRLWAHSLGLGRYLGRPLPLIWPAQQAALVAAVLAALGYGLIAGMQVPALRTVTMLAVAALALWVGRAPPASVVLAWAAGIAVAIDPWAVMSPGFWLSFGAVAVIFLAARRERAPPPEGWQARGRALLVEAARTQWAVTIGLVPLTLLLFGQVSVVSCIANAMAIPVVSLLVTPMALVGAVLPLAWATPLLAVAHELMAWLVAALAWLATPTWAVWEAAHPGPVALALALSGVVVVLAPRATPGVSAQGGAKVPSTTGLVSGLVARFATRLASRSAFRSTLRSAPPWRAHLPPRWQGVLLMLPMLVAGRDPVAPGEFRVTALDVGQGTAVLVETRSHALLYDAGPAYASGTSAGGQVIVPFLRAAGVRRLDLLMVSHEDADHAGGVRDLLAMVPVGARLTGAPLAHPLLANVAGKRGERGKRGESWKPCMAGGEWVWDGVSFAILHPSEADLANGRLASNARSCVLRVATAHRSMLLTGDIGEREERALVARVPPHQLRADILLVPHHGSGTSSGAAFLRAVRPQAAVFQLGYANRYRHPRDDVWKRYERAGIARFRADETGAVTVVTRGGHHVVSTYRQQVRRYWRDAPPAPR